MTTAFRSVRSVLSLTWPLLAILALYEMAGCISIAHADAGAAVAPAAAGLPWQIWIVAVLAALAGFETLLKGLSMIGHAISPRTKTLADDKVTAGIDELHDKVDVLREDLAEIAKVVVPSASVAKASGSSSGTAAMLAVLLLGGIAVMQTGCTKEKLATVATNAEHGLVNCTAQAIGTTPALDLATLVAVANTVAVEKQKCTVNGTLSWSCVEADAIGEGKVLGGCTIVQLLAAELAPGTTARMASADPGRAALEDFRVKMAGGAMFHTAGGDI